MDDMSKDDAMKKLDGMLKAAGTPKRASYTKAEVCRILHISERTFWRYVGARGRQQAWMLDSFMTRGHYRVAHDDLAAWLYRNQTLSREPDDISDQPDMAPIRA
jgi:hypothetical protein